MRRDEPGPSTIRDSKVNTISERKTVMNPNCDFCNGTAQITPEGFRRIGKVVKVRPRWREGLQRHCREFFGSDPLILHEPESKYVFFMSLSQSMCTLMSLCIRQLRSGLSTL